MSKDVLWFASWSENNPQRTTETHVYYTRRDAKAALHGKLGYVIRQDAVSMSLVYMTAGFEPSAIEEKIIRDLTGE